MAKFDVLVRDGRFVTLSGSTKLGIAIKDGRIATLGNNRACYVTGSISRVDGGMIRSI